jgi:hypothetical protein
MNKNKLHCLDIETYDRLLSREWRNLQEGDDIVHPCFLGLDPTLHKYSLVSGENFSAEGKEGSVGFQTEDLIMKPTTESTPEAHGALLCCSPDFLDALLLTEKIDNAGEWVDRVELYGGYVFLVQTKGIQEASEE